jgi:hypothetical protein
MRAVGVVRGVVGGVGVVVEWIFPFGSVGNCQVGSVLREI